jgi:hypothetical protein
MIMAKDPAKTMMGIMKTGITYGVTSSVVSNLPASGSMGTITKDVAGAGLGILAVKDITKKIKL